MKKIIVLLVAMLVMISGCGKETATESDKGSKQEQKAEDVKIKEAKIEKSDKSTLKVTTKAAGKKLQYSYYIYKDDKEIEKVWYTENNSFTYTAKEPGTYYVRVYVKDGNGKVDTQNTSKVKVEK
ncbi:triple tyrosine motif-containing protein [Bacillus rhizoplanae]|uniref:triple tyrosine motif-containing protein n=1 Tax=Bacillus rhizoplanae TaxID=2880966 RepID=UPI003D1A03BA